MNKLPERKQNRLKTITYTENGAYFITICSKDRKCLFSNVIEQSYEALIELTELGCLIDYAINEIDKRYDNVSVVKYVIMPNHIHLIMIVENNGGRMISAPTVIGSLKRYVSRQFGESVWQKGFYDHVVRDPDDFEIKWRYIDENPAKWLLYKDEYNPI